MTLNIDFIRRMRSNAKQYFALGFNITGIKNYEKRPYHGWKHHRIIRQTKKHALSHPWAKLTGIGVITRGTGFLCLDFDQCDLSNVGHFLAKLGLPEDYNWVVVSGSGKGFHIWFRSDQLENQMETMGSVIVVKPKIPSLFKQLELRINCHVVMPPSKAANGNEYRFLYSNALTEGPRELDITKPLDHQFLNELMS